MRSQYGEYTGQPFPTPDSLFPQPKVIELILQYGQKALDAMENLEEPSDKEFVEQLVQAGLLERDENTGALRLTPKMLRGIEHRALLEIFRGLSQGGNREGHLASATGRSEERADGSRTYQFGDPIHELDLAATLRNAMHRAVVERSQTGEPAASRGGTSAGPSGLKEGEGKANPAPGFTAPATGSAGPSGLRGGLCSEFGQGLRIGDRAGRLTLPQGQEFFDRLAAQAVEHTLGGHDRGRLRRGTIPGQDQRTQLERCVAQPAQLLAQQFHGQGVLQGRSQRGRGLHRHLIPGAVGQS